MTTMQQLRRLVPGLVLVVVTTAPMWVGATVLMDWTLSERVAHSDLIVIGTIAGASTVEVDGNLMTVTDIDVESVLLGRAPARISVWQFGGERDGKVMRVVGDARLIPGARMLLLTHLYRDGRRYLVGMSMGAYLVQGHQLTGQLDAPLLRDGEIVSGPGEQHLEVRDVVNAISETHR